MAQWNTRNPAVKRIVQELREMEKESDPDILAEAIEVRGLPGAAWRADQAGATKPSAARPHSAALPRPAPPAQDNIFEWHFVIRGACDSEFEVRGGQEAAAAAVLPASPAVRLRPRMRRATQP